MLAQCSQIAKMDQNSLYIAAASSFGSHCNNAADCLNKVEEWTHQMIFVFVGIFQLSMVLILLICKLMPFSSIQSSKFYFDNY